MQLADALARRGHEVTVVAREGSSVPDGVKLVLLPARAMAKTARYGRFLTLIDEHLRENKYDIIHAMLPVRHCDIYHPHAGLAAEAMERGHLKHGGMLRKNVSRLTNRMHVRRRYFRSVERKLLRSPAPPIVLCVSELVKREVRQHYPLPDDRLAVLFNAVDLERLDPGRDPAARAKVRQQHQIDPEKMVALLVAQNFKLKGLRVAIEAVAAVNNPKLVLVVLGKESPAPYQRLAQKLGVEKQIIFAGTTNDIYSYYAAADFIVLPTMRDSCSLVVLEALAMGRPVISTRTNGACEIITNGVHGFVVDNASDVPALSQGMKKLLDPHFRKACGQSCQELRSVLSFDKHLERLESIYRHVRQG